MKVKLIKEIALIKVQDGRLTIFNNAVEKERFYLTHKDAEIYGNHAIEPLYMLVDTNGSGFNLTPKFGITYNEAIDLINRYY